MKRAKETKTFTFYVKEPTTDKKACSAKEVFEMMKDLFQMDQESFWCVLLNAQNKVIKTDMIHLGCMDSSPVDMKILFRRALQNGASGIICVHNHPSGNVTPSSADLQVTNQIKKCAELLCVKFLDHVIIGEGKYFSFVEEGLI